MVKLLFWKTFWLAKKQFWIITWFKPRNWTNLISPERNHSFCEMRGSFYRSFVNNIVLDFDIRIFFSFFYFTLYLWQPIKDIPENGADINHLDHVHGPPFVSGNDLRYSFSSWWQFAKHKWSTKWKPLENDEKHVGHLKLAHFLSIFGYKIPYTDFHLSARQVCVPGILLYTYFQIHQFISNIPIQLDVNF